MRSIFFFRGFRLLWCVLSAILVGSAQAQWLPVENVNFTRESTEHGGAYMVVEYDLGVQNLSTQAPAYVFLRYSTDGGANWRIASPHQLRGEGYDIVVKGGRHTILWWGSDQLGLTREAADLKITVRAIQMVRVAGGAFVADMIPGGGFDQSKTSVGEVTLPTYFLARFETTVGMYADYLNEVGRNGLGWNRMMENPERCGIQRMDGDVYMVAQGREKFPINYVSWYEAQAFLDWCGLRLPTEFEFLKAFRGGIYLDGDQTKHLKNSAPKRKYPWGDESPGHGGLWRCNCDVADPNRPSKLVPTGSFSKYNSPYDVADLAGNVGEWTLNWYSTSFHSGLDGYRMYRGGSYMDPMAGCDAMAGASQLPVTRGSIIGFRAVRGISPTID